MANNTSAQHRNDQLLLEFNNVDAAGVGDAGGLRGSVTAGNWYLGLHYASVGTSGNQETSEASYPGYARKAIPRTAGGFTVTANAVVNAAVIDFTKASGVEPNGGGLLAFWSLGDDAGGAGKVRYFGPVTSALATTPIIAGVIPRVEAGALTITKT